MSLVSLPFAFTPGTLADATQVDANQNAIVAVVNGGLDNTNVGSAGFYASQIIPTNAAQATFGGASQYFFPTQSAGISIGKLGSNNFPAIDIGNNATPGTGMTRLHTVNSTLLNSLSGAVLAILDTTAGYVLVIDGNGSLGVKGVIRAGTALSAFGVAEGVSPGQVSYGGTTSNSATAGGTQAVPATVAGYIVINVAGTARKLPYFAT